MPQVEGQEIHKTAPSPQAINEAWLRPVLQRLLEALAYLHGEGLLHRDIKPSNILIRAGGSPLLIDFGTARSSDATHTLTRVGSPGFSPAEQFTARGKNGAWTDLSSLGATCYYLITGEVPQDAVGRMEEDELRLLAERNELHGRFSSDFLSTIDKAMRVPRKDRWQSAQEWLEKLAPAHTPVQPHTPEKDSPAAEPLTTQQADEPDDWRLGCLLLGALFFCFLGGWGIGWLIGGELGGVIGLFIGVGIGVVSGVVILDKIEKR